MPNISEMNQELVRAFNTSLCCHNIAVTNLTVQNLHGKDHIVISFYKNMDSKQCMKYLSNMKEKIIKRSYRDEKAAGISYNLKFFPFAFNTKHLPRDDKGRKKFSVEIDEGVVFNLKCYLAQALAGDIQEDMGKKFGVEYAKKRTKDINFDRNSYLLCMRFDDKKLQIYFINSFLSKIESYGNAPASPDDYLEVNGDYVYIKKSIFDNIEFIKDIEAHDASLICRDFEISIKEDRRLESLKFPIIDFIHRVGIPVYHLFHTAYKGSDENSVLIPIVAKNEKGNRLLDDNDAYKINSAFGMKILSDVGGNISARLPKSDSSDGIVYGIDFADPDISYCVMNKIMESSVINKDHELSIDPELHFRALSPVQSPLNSLTHAGPSGLRTPPKQRQEDRDSGYDSNSPPKPKDSGASSGGPGPSSKMSQPQLESPTRSQDVALEGSPRQESEQKQGLYYPVNLAGTSKGFWPPTQLSYTTVSQGVSGPSSQSVSAAGNVQVGTSQSMNLWSSPASSTGLWSLPQMSSFVSGPSSSKGANPVGANLWTKNSNPLPPLPPLVSLIPLPVSGSSVSGFSPLVSFTSTQNPYPLPPPPPLIPSSGGIVPRFRLPVARPSSSRGAQAGANISEKEEKLIEALLYWFNLNNYALDPPHTNFIAENGKIASLIDDSVNVKEYLQEIIDKTKEEYRVNKEEAYDLNEFPFQFLSNCEKNQEITVVANISRGALLNLKKLFSREHEGKVEIKDIDINIVEKAVKSEKNKWVNFQVQEHGLLPQKAIETCYPDESALEYISITKDKGGYWINRNYDASEVRSFRKEQWPAKGTRNTTTTFKKIEESKKDDSSSGYSSGFVTDAENVSSKAEAITSSGYESMDCENTRGGSPKRTLELSMGMEELAISTDLDATKAEQHSPIKKFRSN